MQDISVVIPVYRGAQTLPALVAELERLHAGTLTPAGRPFRVTEVLLVWDRGPDSSDTTIRTLAAEYPWVRPVWLSRNYGQHPATLAGMVSSTGQWIVTMDEDGQHDPAYIGAMLDTAYQASSQLVYAAPSNEPPHGFFRNVASRSAKWFFLNVLAGRDFEAFHSYRLMLGEVGRSSAAYTGPGVFLDVALSWVVAGVATCPVPMRNEGRPASNYSFGALLRHFGRLVMSSGTRPLAFVSGLGLVVFVVGILTALWVFMRVLSGEDLGAQGWASTFTALLVIGGLVLFSLGVIAQYMRSSIDMSLGKPLYVVVHDPNSVFGDAN